MSNRTAHSPSLTLMSASTKFRPVRTTANISPAMRVIAAVVLVCWSVALAICWHHCATGACNSNGKTAKNAQPSCHAHSGDSESDGSQPNTAQNSCFAKKPFSGKLDLASVSAPTLHLAYANALLVVEYELPNPNEAVLSRQSRSREWVFTPEVCLGPAFRSLAPPVLA
jgi:hypothetical protein